MRKLTVFNFFTFFLTVVLLIIHSFPMHAIGANQQGYLQQAVKPHNGVSQRRAIAIAQEHIKGRVLDIKQQDGVYRVKILSDKGSIHIVQINVRDGKIITDH